MSVAGVIGTPSTASITVPGTTFMPASPSGPLGSTSSILAPAFTHVGSKSTPTAAVASASAAEPDQRAPL